MLETSQPSREGTTRTAARPLPASTPRPALRPASTPLLPARRGRPARTPDRLARSEARLLTMAISCTAVVCALLVMYLAAYAHISLLGDEQAQMRTTLRQKRLENEQLRDTLALLQSPDHVSAAAVTLGMTRDPSRVDYIAPAPNAPQRTADAPSQTLPTTPTPPLEAHRGPTNIDIAARND